MTPRNASRQSKPQSDLSGLDDWQAGAQRVLYRCHSSDFGPWFFSSAPADDEQGPGGRWEVQAPDGTCHTGTGTAAALWERFGPDFHDLGFVPQDSVARTKVIFLDLDTSKRIADLQGPAGPRLGVTGELSTTGNYDMTQVWAQAAHDIGWDGIKAASRFAPQHDVVALFGPAGAADEGPGTTGDAGDSVRLARMAGLIENQDFIPALRKMQIEHL